MNAMTRAILTAVEKRFVSDSPLELETATVVQGSNIQVIATDPHDGLAIKWSFKRHQLAEAAIKLPNRSLRFNSLPGVVDVHA